KPDSLSRSYSFRVLWSCREMTNVTVLGSTGSIGVSTLDVVRRRSDEFAIFALVAGANAELLAKQIGAFRPRMVAVATEKARAALVRQLEEVGLPRSAWPEIGVGTEAQVRCASASEVGIVLSAIVGVAG